MNPRIANVMRFLLGVLVVFVALVVAGMFAIHAGVPETHRFDLVYRILLVVFLLFGFSVLLIVSDKIEGNPLAAMGLGVRGPWIKDALLGLAFGGGMVVVAVAVIGVGGHMDMTAHLTRRTAIGAIAVIVILKAGALAEELMFRGYPFQRLVDGVGATWAIVVLSAAFGAVHLGNPHATVWGFLNTVLIGILLSLSYLRTRSLWMPWGIHLGWNAVLGLGFGLPVSGLMEFATVVRSRAQGPVWLTGGSYGIEASALGAAVIALGLAVLVKFVPQRPPLVMPQMSTDAGSESILLPEVPEPGPSPTHEDTSAQGDR